MDKEMKGVVFETIIAFAFVAVAGTYITKMAADGITPGRAITFTGLMMLLVSCLVKLARRVKKIYVGNDGE